MSFVNIFTIITTGLSLIIHTVLIFLILRKDSKNLINRSLALYLFLIVIFQVIGGVIMLFPDPGFSLNLYRSVAPFFFFIPLLFYIFVQKLLKKKIPKLVILVNILVCIFFPVFSIFRPASIVKNVVWSEAAQFYILVLNFPLGAIAISLFSFLFFIAFFNLLRAYHHSKSVIERNRLKYLFLGILVIPIGFIVILLPPFQPYPIDMIMMTLGGVLFTYAVIRYKLLDITVIIRKGLLYSILTTTVTGIYLFFALFLQLLFKKPEAFISLPATFSTALVVALIFQPLQKATQRLIDKIFFRSKYDAQKLVAELSQIFSETLDLKFLTKIFIKILCETIQIKEAALFLVNEETNKLEIQEIRDISPKIKGLAIKLELPLVKLLSESEKVQTKHELQENNIDFGGLEKFDLDLFVPLRIQERLTGVLVLGPKLSEELYSLEEYNLLETIGHSAALALNNAFLFTQLAKEKEKVEEARVTLEVKVQARTKELRELAGSLDEQVKERTKELQNKIKELERFYKLTVGRELKMIELKKALGQDQNKKRETKKN